MYGMILEQEYMELYEKLTQELRRGILVLATLSQLKEEKYGYALISDLAEWGLEIEQGTLYPLLRRLESQGLLQSSWDVAGSRPRRYYQINESGMLLLAELTDEWHKLTDVMSRLLKAKGAEK
jgi:PadR family transcriptional regulator PadR